MLTTKCSAGCSHCPFSNPTKNLFLTPQTVEKILSQTNAKLTVLSGGEPFEHPEISEILSNLIKQTRLFRIATGGFIDLTPWLDKLKSLAHPSGTLQGISIGTDAVSSRVHHANWVPIWRKNIQLLYQHQISYSLTFTAGKDLEFSWLNLWRWDDFFTGKPEFIYVRADTASLEEWTQKLQVTFQNIPIIQDKIS